MNKIISIILVASLAFLSNCGIEEDIVVVNGSVEILPGNAGLLPGQTKQYKARYVEQSSEASDVSFTWTSSNPSVATVDANGLVTAIATGSTSITATAFGASSVASTVNVVEDPTSVASIDLVGGLGFTGALLEGDTASLIAVAWNSDQDAIEGIDFTWVSSNPSVATVDANGLVTAVSAGSATITANAENVASNPLSIQVSQEAIIRTATLQGSGGYSASGDVELFINDNGELELSFLSNVQTPGFTNAPGVYVYLANGTTASAATSNGLEIALLPQNIGPYSLIVPTNNPAETLTQFDNIVIVCVPFNITFGSATFAN